jgi:hypothetical protein
MRRREQAQVRLEVGRVVDGRSLVIGFPATLLQRGDVDVIATEAQASGGAQIGQLPAIALNRMSITEIPCDVFLDYSSDTSISGFGLSIAYPS